jgi:TIR domain
VVELGGIQMGYIFISYSHKDKAYVHKLQKALQNEGFDVWVDDRIDYGTTWPTVIQKHLDDCAAFIVVMTENAFESDWVQNEVTRARRKKKPFFALLLRGDTWLSVEAIQYEDVTGERLPQKKFYESLASVTSRKTQNTEKADRQAAEKAERVKLEGKDAEKATQEKAEKEIQHRLQRTISKARRKYLWESFKINISYRLELVRIYALPLLFASIAVGGVVFLAIYIAKNVPIQNPTPPFGSTSPPYMNLTSTKTSISTDSHTPGPVPTATIIPVTTYFPTPTFQSHLINWGGIKASISGQPILFDTVKQVQEVAQLQIRSAGSYGAYNYLSPELITSPDGRLILYALGKIIYIRRIQDGAITRTLVNSHNVVCFTLSSDGNLLTAVSGGGKIRVWKIDDGSLVQDSDLKLPDIYYGYVALSPNGSWLAIIDSNTIIIRRVSDGTLVKVLKNLDDSTSYFDNVIFSPDGALLVGIGYDQVNNTKTAFMWDVKDWTLTHPLQNAGYQSAFSPDGSLFASIIGRDRVSVWRVADGSLIRTFKDSSSPYVWLDEPLFFLANGQILVFGSSNDAAQGLRLWRVSDGFSIRDIGLSENAFGGAVSADGSTIFLLTGSNIITMRSLAVALP